MNAPHRAVLRVVVRIIGRELPVGNAHTGHACDGPELAEAQASGRAFTCDLDCAENLDALRGFTMAIRSDDPVPAAILELEDQAIADRAADRVHAGIVAPKAEALLLRSASNGLREWIETQRASVPNLTIGLKKAENR
jgi:hypothetical protein